MYEHILIRLKVRRFGTVSLGIRHGAVYHQIVVLHIYQEFLEVFMVVCSVLLIYFICGGIYGVKGIHSHTSLEAACCFLTKQSLHLDLVLQVLRALVDVGETVYFSACKV